MTNILAHGSSHMLGQSRLVITNAGLTTDERRMVVDSASALKSRGLLKNDGAYHCKADIKAFEMRITDDDCQPKGYKVDLKFYRFRNDTRPILNCRPYNISTFFFAEYDGMVPVLVDYIEDAGDGPYPDQLEEEERPKSCIPSKGWLTVDFVLPSKDTVTVHISSDFLDFATLYTVMNALQEVADEDDLDVGTEVYCVPEISDEDVEYCNGSDDPDVCNHKHLALLFFAPDPENPGHADFTDPKKRANFEMAECEHYYLNYMGTD